MKIQLQWGKKTNKNNNKILLRAYAALKVERRGWGCVSGEGGTSEMPLPALQQGKPLALLSWGALL